MITRRRAFLGFAAAPLAAKAIPFTEDLPEHLQSLVHYFDPKMGDLGRGHILPLDRIIDIKKEIQEYGFEPYLTPGLSGFSSQFLGIYGSSGAPAYGIWFGFVREHQGSHQVVAFETDQEAVGEFIARTGCGGLHAALGNDHYDVTERERCIRIVEASVPERPDRMSLPSSYDAIELRDGTVERTRLVNHEYRVRWSIQRLTAKSIVASISGTDRIALDEHDDLALMEIGRIPGPFVPRER